MKVRVDGMVWVSRSDLGERAVAQLRRKLTIVPRKIAAYDDTRPTPVRCYGETKTHFGFPRDYFFATSNQQHQVTWDLSHGSPAFQFESLIRSEGDFAEQVVAIERLVGWFRAEGVSEMERGRRLGAILRADPGFGKTVTALAVAHTLGVTTVVVVHKEFLLRQWIKYVNRFLPEAKVGVVQEGKCEFEGRDIVIAMAQSLALEGQDGKRRYPGAFYDWPGLLVSDECHRVGAPTWAPVPPMFRAAFRLGLTATPRRKDGCADVFFWHIGPVRYHAQTERPKLDVRMVESGVSGPEFIHRDGISPATVVNIIAKLTRRNHKIVDEIVRALKSPQGRKIMVLSERLAHLRLLDEMLLRACEEEGLEGITTGFYTGEWFTGDRSRKLAERTWPMEKQEDRDKALQVLYRSFVRRRHKGSPRALKDADGKRFIFLRYEDDGGLARSITEAAWIALGEKGRRPPLRDDDWVSLDELTPTQIYTIARIYDIAQKVVEKKKTRTPEELEEAERARVVWATYQMTSEGIDIPAVDVIVFATPVSDVEQSYGRGRRVCIPKRHGGTQDPETCAHYCPWRADSCKGKPKPIACDIVDLRIPLSKRRRSYRMDFYDDLKVGVAGSGAP